MAHPPPPPPPPPISLSQTSLDFFIGDEALDKPGYSPKYPIRHGICEDWDLMVWVEGERRGGCTVYACSVAVWGELPCVSAFKRLKWLGRSFE